MDPVTRRLDLSDGSITENTRAAYPLRFIKNRRESGCGGVPKHIVMLTCDAFGVLPPISKLTPAQAQFWFLTGYTVRLKKSITTSRCVCCHHVLSSCVLIMCLDPGQSGRD
jgi:phosphoenolpyruvate carboxykinase (ATP)